MSSTTTAMQQGIAVEQLAEYYGIRTVDLVTAGTKEQKDVESGRLREGSVGAARATAGPAAYAAAKKCEEIAKQLVEANAELVKATREWKRLTW